MVWQLRNYWGLTIRLALPGLEFFARLNRLLPPVLGSNTSSLIDSGIGTGGDVSFVVESEGSSYVLYKDQEKIVSCTDWNIVADRLERALQNELGCHCPHAVFVHSGVVALDGRALLLPARSYSGKSSMTYALTKLGAAYLSDEFAVIDHDGWVHPYRRAMTIRRENGAPDRRISPSNLPLPPGPCRISLVIDCQYEKGARWAPQPLSQGEGVLSLFSNTVSAQLSPQRDIAWLTTAMKGARTYRALRGDVRYVAPKLLALLESS